MRVGHRLRELQEQAQARCQRLAATGGIDRLAVHRLHHEVGPAVWQLPGVEQPGDVRVVQPRQQALFLREPLPQRGRGGAAVQQLDGHARFEGAVGAARGPDLAHPACAQPVRQFPGTKAQAGVVGFGQGLGRPRRRVGEKAAAAAFLAVVLGQQLAHLGGNHGCSLRQQRQPGSGRQCLGLLEQGPDGKPVVWRRRVSRHAADARSTTRCRRRRRGPPRQCRRAQDHASQRGGCCTGPGRLRRTGGSATMARCHRTRPPSRPG